MIEPAAVLSAVCQAISSDGRDEAAAILRRDYPFTPMAVIKRRYGPRESTRVFVRDGFIDRYSGQRLIFPPVLRVISEVLPAEFPFHPNWKTDVTHPAYNALSATIDHVVPVTRGGRDDDSNWVTTSMARNFAKMNSTLEEIGWTLHPAGRFEVWDGLLRWFITFAEGHPDLVRAGSIRQWYVAAKEGTDLVR